MNRISLSISLILTLAILGFGQNQYFENQIVGTLTDVRGDAIADAEVSLRGPGQVSYSTRTDAKGSFKFERLQNGEYAIKVSVPGFDTVERVVVVSGSGPVSQNITLNVAMTKVTVTADMGQAEDVSRIPQPVTAIGSTELKNRVTSAIAQAAKEEVGLNIQRTSPTIGAVVVRGLTGKNVVNYVDGVRYTNGGQRGGINTFFNLNDAAHFDTVEVLRGPNSAQYGSDSLGGTVNLISRAPTTATGDKSAFHGELLPSFTSADRSFGTSGFLTYGKGNFGGLVSFAARRVNTLRTADGLDSHSAITRFLGLPSSVLYDRNPDTEFTQYGGAARVNYSPADEHQLIFFYQRGQQDDGKRSDQLLGGDGNLIADLRNLMLDFGYARYLASAVPYFDTASFTVSYNSQREERVNQGGQGNPFGDITHQYERTTATGFSFYLDRQLPGRNAFLIGGDAYHEKLNSPAYVMNAAGVATLSRPRVPDEAKFDSAGIFIQNSWDAIRDRLRISGALRYSGVLYRARAADAPVIAGRPLWNDDSLRTADLSGRIGGVIRVVDKLRVALNYSRGFRYPSMTDLGTLGLTGDGFEVDHLAASGLGGTVGTTALETAVTTGIPVTQQRSEYSNNLDFTVRYDGNRFKTAFTAFLLDITDTITKQALVLPAGAVDQLLGDRRIVSQTPTGTVFVEGVATPVFVRANYTDARLHGFEIESEGRITSDLSARGNFTVVHSADKVTGLPPNIEGGTPPPTAFVSLRYGKPRFWIEAYSTIAGEQDRLSSLDLGDRRTGAGRSRTQIQNFFRRGACVNGLTTPGASGCGSAGGILIATGETLTQVQNRLLPIGATVNGVTVIDDNTVVPLFLSLPSYATANVRGGFTFNENATVFAAFENITDAFYRNPSWGIDGTGRSLTVQFRYRF